jgi:tetratricopeptide (TPR) repeat protein
MQSYYETLFGGDVSVDIHPIIEAAQGYVLLGMYSEAWQEIHKLTPQEQLLPAVIDLRVALHMQEKHWKEALDILEPLCQVVPDRDDYFVHAAFCLHEMNRTKEARDKLLSGPDSLVRQPLFHYNLACYETRLGEPNLAKISLERCFKLDESFRAIALKDDDLKELKPWLIEDNNN